MGKTTKTVSIDLDIDSLKYISEIVKRTGETKVDLFTRIVASEHKRVINGESVSESVNKNLESILSILNKVAPQIEKAADDSAAVRKGANKILNGINFIMKELFRTMHFISKMFTKISGLDAAQMSKISNDTNVDSVKSFNIFYDTLAQSSSKEILDILSK